MTVVKLEDRKADLEAKEAELKSNTKTTAQAIQDVRSTDCTDAGGSERASETG